MYKRQVQKGPQNVQKENVPGSTGGTETGGGNSDVPYIKLGIPMARFESRNMVTMLTKAEYIVGNMPNGGETVSYTHLDVYKRQVEDNPKRHDF